MLGGAFEALSPPSPQPAGPEEQDRGYGDRRTPSASGLLPSVSLRGACSAVRVSRLFRTKLKRETQLSVPRAKTLHTEPAPGGSRHLNIPARRASQQRPAWLPLLPQVTHFSLHLTVSISQSGGLPSGSEAYDSTPRWMWPVPGHGKKQLPLQVAKLRRGTAARGEASSTLCKRRDTQVSAAWGTHVQLSVWNQCGAAAHQHAGTGSSRRTVARALTPAGRWALKHPRSMCWVPTPCPALASSPFLSEC